MLLWIVIVPILLAIVIYIYPSKKSIKLIAITAQLILTAATFYIFLLSKESVLIENIGNYEEFLGIILKVDSLSSVFIMLTAFLFLFVAIYSLNDDNGRLYWFLLFIWQGLLLGLFLSNDLFNLFVIAEVATVVVSILIMLKKDKRSMYDGMIYLMANTVAIQFYLFGVGYIYKLTGVMDLSGAAAAIKELPNSSLILPYALIITSVSLKCALMPLFSWLPKAHGTPGAPTTVSAILSGLHIKSGIYLFIRFQSMFAEIVPTEFFLIAGIITGIAGFIFALSQTDIKLILAYSTISQIGMIMIGLNDPNINSFTGGVYHIINHAIFKSVLFLCAGSIIQNYGTRNITKIRGVFKRMPVVGIATLMAIFGITGTPFFNGSISKYFIDSGAGFIVSAAIIFINLGTITLFIKFSSILFGFGKQQVAMNSNLHNEESVVTKDIFKQISVLALGIFCFLGGIFSEQIIWFLFNVNISVDTISYLQKIILFIVSVAVGFFANKYFISVNSFFKRIREIELSFRGICISIGIFFLVILLVAYL